MKLTNIVWHQFNYDRAIINNSCREMFWNSSHVIIQEQRMGMVLTNGSNAWDGIMQCSFYIRIRLLMTLQGSFTNRNFFVPLHNMSFKLW